MSDTPLSQNIKALRLSFGLRQNAFAEKLGTGQSSVSKWESGVVPDTRWLQKLADLARCSIAQFQNEIWNPEAIVGDHVPTKSIGQGEMVEIMQLDLSLPMGPGATVDDYLEAEPRIFDLAYIRAFSRTPPHRLRIARGVGDSMYPTLVSSDLVWIDSTQMTLNQQDRIWAVSINGAAAIKRLRTLKGGRVLIISDNPMVADQQVDADEISIGGRVIRFARDI